MFWLGLERLGGKFVYDSDQSSVGWTDWYPGVPNNSYNNEHCVTSADWASWKWVDDWCGQLASVVCQQDY